jgi:hypothetical protein
VSVAVPPRKRAPKKKTALIVGASVVAVAVVAVLLANLADSGSGTKAAKKKATTTTTPAATSTALKLRLGAAHIQNTGLPTKVKLPVRLALVKIAQGYVDNAIMAPLEKGAVNNAYATSFDPGVKRAAARTDRAVLTEVRTGAATGPVKATASPVRIDVVGDPTGKIALAATTFTMQIKAPTAKGLLTIRRRTELTFANEFGRWYVTAYRVTVRRSLGAKTTSSTASTSTPNGTTT